MEIAIIKRESTGTGANMFTENETIAKYEIMDGAPVKGESIPIRVFLGGYNLTPTMRDINKKFSVKYFLNLVLMDTEDRRYFKQQEITLWRKADIPRYHAQNQQHASGQGHHHPQHAPPHLVGGPPNNTLANAATTVESSNDDATIAGGEANTTAGGGGGGGASSAEGKMGLFTRESPNQDFSEKDSLLASPTTPPPQPPTATATAKTVPIERGIGDGAAAMNNSPVMLSTTPPPLPPLVDGLTTAQRDDFLIDVQPIDVRAAGDAGLGSESIDSDDGMTNVSLSSATTEKQSTKDELKKHEPSVVITAD